MFGYNDCRGIDAKEKIVANYFITPIAHLPLPAWSKKAGCCGELEKEYHVFSYTNISKREERGIFFLGRKCSKELIDIVNIKKKRAKKSELLVPAYFDEHFESKIKRITSDLNSEILYLCNALFLAWDMEPEESFITSIMLSIYLFPEKNIPEKTLLALNKIVSRDYMVANKNCETFTESLSMRKKTEGVVPFADLKNIRMILDIKNEKNYIQG